MEHILVGGQYDGKVVNVQYGDEISLPRQTPCPPIDLINADPMHSTPIDNERYVRRDFYRDGKHLQVFAHSSMTDEQVMKVIGL